MRTCARRAAFAAFTVTTILAAAVLSTAASAQDAADWPSEQITIVAPFAAGGSADQLGRLLAEGLSEKYDQRVIVENRPGNAGVTGSQLVAGAEPDGYTLVVSGIASHVIAPAVNEAVPYDPMADFTHIAFLGGPPTVVAVANNTDIADFAGFLETAKAADPALRYAVPGYGTHGHLVGEYLKTLAGIQMEAVAYKGGAEAGIDLVGGHVPAASNSLLSTMQHIRSGAITPIAVTTEERIAAFPDIPTFVELGYPDLVAVTWFSLSGPAGMAPEIVAKLNADVREVLAGPAAQEKFSADGVILLDMDAAAFQDYVARETQKWTKVVETTGIRQ